MTMLNTSTSWNVGRVAGRCAACSAELPPNTACWAALCDGLGMRSLKAQRAEPDAAAAKAKKEEPPPSPFIRVDFCESCWAQGRRPEQVAPESLGFEASAGSKFSMFSFWKTTVPVPQQKKKLLVDDSVLAEVFQRMEGKTEPQEVRFRFVLALILMRKRLLKYEGMDEATREKASAENVIPDSRVPEIWRMTPRGAGGTGWAEQSVHVINPHLTAEQITEVSQQLSAILAEEI